MSLFLCGILVTSVYIHRNGSMYVVNNQTFLFNCSTFLLLYNRNFAYFHAIADVLS